MGTLLPLKDAIEIVKEPWRPGDEDTKYIGLEHINEGTLSLNGVGTSGSLESNKFRFRSGDILFGKLRPYFRKVVTPDFDGVCSTDIWVMRAKEGFDQRFLFYFMANPVLVAQSSGASTGTKMPRADWDFLGNTTWLFPSFSEQQSIAEILSSLNDKIVLLHKQNEALEQIAQVIFNESFVQKLGGQDLPKGWRVEGLASIADFLNGLPLQKYPVLEASDYLPVVKIKELKAGITDSTDKAGKDVPEKYVVNNGDILFSWSGSLEVVIWKYGAGALNQHLFKVTSDDYPKWFYYFWLLHHLPSFRSIAANKATTMGHIQRYHLDQAQVVIPDEITLRKVNESIGPVFEKLIMNNTQTGTLSSLRDSLIPRLIDGKLRAEANAQLGV